MSVAEPLVVESRLTLADWAVVQQALLERVRARFSVPDPDGLVLGRVRLELSADGIRIQRADATALTRWSALREVTRTQTHLLLWIDPLSAYILPLRDLPESLDAEAVVERLQAFAGPLATTGLGSGVPPVAAGGGGFVGTLLRRLAWHPAPESGAGSGDAVVISCAVVALAVWLAFDRYAVGAGATWYPGGVPGLAWYAAGILALAWVLTRASSPAARYGSLLASLVGALPLILALGLAIHQWVPEWLRPSAYALLGLAAVLYVWRALVAASGTRRLRALVAGGLLVLAFAWGTSQAWVDPHLWLVAEEEEEEEEGEAPWREGERLLFEQADRIDAAASRVAGGRPGRADVFFLGFAGVGEQKVFAEELALAERVVAERYGTGDRSLLLVNDRRDRDTWPLATVHGLRRALVRLGERMDRAEDVLFLLLTSHGSDAPELSVSNGSWPLAALDGEALRSALDASGIRWRVVVISACYSGGFIEALSDENTIVLTSAARDRVSFGCSDERDVTEFGAAFLRDALPRAESLASAFEEARLAIAERERQEGLEASMPQAHYGRAIAKRWQRIEAEAGRAAGR